MRRKIALVSLLTLLIPIEGWTYATSEECARPRGYLPEDPRPPTPPNPGFICGECQYGNVRCCAESNELCIRNLQDNRCSLFECPGTGHGWSETQLKLCPAWTSTDDIQAQVSCYEKSEPSEDNWKGGSIDSAQCRLYCECLVKKCEKGFLTMPPAGCDSYGPQGENCPCDVCADAPSFGRPQ